MTNAPATTGTAWLDQLLAGPGRRPVEEGDDAASRVEDRDMRPSRMRADFERGEARALEQVFVGKALGIAGIELDDADVEEFGARRLRDRPGVRDDRHDADDRRDAVDLGDVDDVPDSPPVPALYASSSPASDLGAELRDISRE